MSWDVVVVGAGTSGCAAGRPAGRRRPPGAAAGGRRRPPAAGGLPGVPSGTPPPWAPPRPGIPANWDLPAQLTEDVSVPGAARPGARRLQRAQRRLLRPRHAGRLRRLGGGRQRPVVGGARCSPPSAGSEADADFGDRPGHGADGPMPVHPPAPAATRSPTPSPRPAPSWASRPSRTRTPAEPPGLRAGPVQRRRRRAGEHRDGLPLPAAGLAAARPSGAGCG